MTECKLKDILDSVFESESIADFIQAIIKPRHLYHDLAQVDTITRSSIGTGAPVSTARVFKCRCCGKEDREITEAGYQQLGWGANQDWVLGLSEDRGEFNPYPWVYNENSN